MDHEKDVELIEKRTEWQGYFRVERYRLRHRRFAGGWSQPVQREVFERGHSTAVLPYDPHRGEVVLIEQFRIAPYACGEPPWLVETIAGVVEAGEAPEAVARREAMEEAGCVLAGPLQRVARFYVSPGGTSEHVDVFCGRCDTSKLGGLHGVEAEGEDIRVVVVALEEALRWLDAGRLQSAPAIVALQWLALHRSRLDGEWAVQPAG